MNGGVPPYVPVSVVAKACGMTHKGARGMLRRAGILMRLGGHDVVGRAILSERLPDAAEDVYRWFAMRPQSDPKEPRGAQTSRGEGPHRQ